MVDAEAGGFVRTSLGKTYRRIDAARTIAPGLHASLVETPSRHAVLLEVPAPLLDPQVVLVDRLAAGNPHVVCAIEHGILVDEASAPGGPYRAAAMTGASRHYALFPSVPGASLSRALAAARAGLCMSSEVVATVAVEIAAALGDTQQLGALKPESIVVMAATGRVRVRGALLEHLASEIEARAPSLRPRFAYLAPELVSAAATRMDARGRLFALGVMLWELATGRVLLPEHPSTARLLADWSLKLPELPVDATPELRAALWALLQRDPDRRPEPRKLFELLAPLYRPGPAVADALGISVDGWAPYL